MASLHAASPRIRLHVTFIALSLYFSRHDCGTDCGLDVNPRGSRSSLCGGFVGAPAAAFVALRNLRFINRESGSPSGDI